VSPLEKEQRQLEHTRLSQLKGKFPSTLGHGTDGSKIVLALSKFCVAALPQPKPHTSGKGCTSTLRGTPRGLDFHGLLGFRALDNRGQKIPSSSK
jgi:hypothetical protein